MRIDQNANVGINGSTVITTADNATTLNLVSTDTDANAGPHLRLSRNATGADSDALGQVEFSGRDDAGNDFIYAQIEAYIVDASNGSEDGYLEIFRGVGGTERVSGMILSSTDTVFNENSADIDFRVESNGNANMLFVDAGNDHVSIGMSSDFGGVLNVNGGAVFDDATTFDPDTLANGRIGIGQIADGGGFAAQGIGWGGSSTGGTAALVASNGTMFLGLGDKASAGTLKTMLQLSQADVVVNQDSLDSDFRVESDDNTHMLFVDGGNDCVGIATSSPNTSGAALVVQANSAAGAIDVVGRSNGGDCINFVL